MKPPILPKDEENRLTALRGLGLLDTEPEERFDRITRIASSVFDVPIAIVSLVDRDRQWFKSRHGIDATETPREISFCGHAILGNSLFVVEDATKDDRFHDNPMVTGPPGIRFYAGCPVMTPNGHRVGTLCLNDVKPREFDAAQAQLLRDMAAMVERELAAFDHATLDPLTGLTNRFGFEMLADHSLCDARR